jgi:hypothetical protein
MNELERHNNSISLADKYRGYSFIVVYTREIAEENIVTTMIMPTKFFYPRVGWDMKDVVTMGLPQDLRFSILRQVKQTMNQDTGIWLNHLVIEYT